ncbi:Spo0E family sporulation regulatory protein-aspartic acid phosphatase [Brevibacillus ginsengisoli]|uniref:Spo0E family sporulation regulatory protein-aspartic acid phosphatase n=1 Tax=Brevibacillus ginsengisoli TaxID=363854 RepID=UPI003CF3058D
MRDKLLEKIELLRQQMIEIGLERGLDHPEVLECSQKIDQLHNELLELDKNEVKSNKLKRNYYSLFLYESRAHFA